MKAHFTPTFLRAYKHLPVQLQQEVRERIALFETDPSHPYLKTYKLKGRLSGRYSFSVNYRYRIVLNYTSKKEAALLTVGDHDVYR